mmetsp:Transcript_29450/g.33732  ORF Transcript_29450/g.33732 Transcript_29450/m.33732 type:complete len:120 (+) Transcript_29450:316-675(+)
MHKRQVKVKSPSFRECSSLISNSEFSPQNTVKGHMKFPVGDKILHREKQKLLIKPSAGSRIDWRSYMTRSTLTKLKEKTAGLFLPSSYHNVYESCGSPQPNANMTGGNWVSRICPVQCH